MSRLFAAIFISAFMLPACQDSATANSEARVIMEDSLRAQADSLIAISFDTLRNSLVRAAGESDFAGAVAFCKLNASTLIASYASHNIVIARISSRLRNPKNAPDSMGQEALAIFQEAADNGQTISPQLKLDADGNYRYYKPIFIQPFCLNCHGTPGGNITAATLDTLSKLYPTDAAINYKNGELRGLWYVLFKTKQTSPATTTN